MKAIFLSFNQALYEDVLETMTRCGVRGFTSLESVWGRGSHNGEPHYGTHAWPTLNSTILSFVDDHLVDEFLGALQTLSDANEEQGIRTFYWDIAGTIG